MHLKGDKNLTDCPELVDFPAGASLGNSLGMLFLNPKGRQVYFLLTYYFCIHNPLKPVASENARTSFSNLFVGHDAKHKSSRPWILMTFSLIGEVNGKIDCCDHFGLNP